MIKIVISSDIIPISCLSGDYMIDQLFGKWKVIAIAESDDRGRKRVLCCCACGKEKVHYVTHLLKNRTSRCNNCRLNDLKKVIPMHRRFGSWTVKECLGPDKHKKIKYKIVCDCGKESAAISSDLVRGKTTKCIDCYNKSRGNNTRTHGFSNTPTYRVWQLMKDRCLRAKSKDYKYYGERGITISESWLDFRNFLHDMGEKPLNMQLDRIDNNNGYNKSNCRWVNAKQNCNNRRPKGTAISNNTVK